jgi:maltose/moltooligosaccharide transporter
MMGRIMQKPALGLGSIWTISFGFFGIQVAFALQNANVSRIFQTLGASMEQLPLLWLAAPLTGLIVQPLVGYFSDRTWGRFGRRRPYFFAGCVLAAIALIFMPHSPVLWAAVIGLWVLDASLNITMEPFRAFVGDMLPSHQRTLGYSMQTIFIGTGALLASMAPWLLTEFLGVSSTAAPGVIPDAVRYSFYIGAVVIVLAVMWTVLGSTEYSPEQLDSFIEPPSLYRSEADAFLTEPPAAFFDKAGAIAAGLGLAASAAVFVFDLGAQLYILTVGAILLGAGFFVHGQFKRAGRTKHFFSQIMADLTTMPHVMRRLAVVQFFSWFALFIMWVYATPAVTAHHFGSATPGTPEYEAGANWVGVMFAAYNGFAALYAFALPWIAARLGKRETHALNLVIGGLGLIGFLFAPGPWGLMACMIAVGVAWASILAMPYSMLADCLPARKMGIYMGIFNFFIVLPQITVASIMGPIVGRAFGDEAIFAFAIAGGVLILATASCLRVAAPRTEPAAV